ncbi:ATP-binding protein [Aulosira sp. FACHB-615]|uniref:ATP-binding protein n=1 Tax=Aulosira sp. FACHB-615 TaxID=2692777 RepID=UPI00168576F2|nr:ATP-binding protein [Aulosira sp. FACHB-615]MBD2489047.1 ATP-binding protein [Aulosira sp. FACHB-615]
MVAVDWLRLFKQQNQSAIGLAITMSITGLGLSVYSLSGTKYDVIEFCFKPKQINNRAARYCTQDKRYIIPEGYWRQEDYVPANPRFQPEGTFVLSDKAYRLRTISATNPKAVNWSVVSLLFLASSTSLVSKRLQRYKREFVAYFEQLKTDLNQEIALNEQQREITSHKITTETEYIKDRITYNDEAARYLDKSGGERDFDREQAIKNNELAELQRQTQIAKLKAEIAKQEAEAAKFRSEANRHLSAVVDPVELIDEIDYESLCPGKVGEIEFYDWRDLIDDAVGIIIAGNSGSGKTSVAVWVAGWLTKDEAAMLLALDPHANVNVLWEELGIYAIADFKLIEKQLLILLDLLDERRSLSREQLDLEPSVIVFADEINACLENFEDKENMELAIKRLGSEARKYKIALIALNQSSNVDDLGISGQMRNNYLLIGLNATARQIAGRWKKDDPRRKHIEEVAYSCVVCGSVPEQVAVHPTHHSYKQFKKKGNKPRGLLPINQLPLTIKLASPVDTQTDWHEDLIVWAQELGRVPNPAEIKDKWQEIMGQAPTSKQLELLHEYLLNQA